MREWGRENKERDGLREWKGRGRGERVGKRELRERERWSE